jgi:arylamine N-acetyltransferase
MTEKLANSLDVIDLDAYFQRIGYQGERLPTLQVLQAIHY